MGPVDTVNASIVDPSYNAVADTGKQVYQSHRHHCFTKSQLTE